MKFKKLNRKYSETLEKYEKEKSFKPGKLEKLQQKLVEKKSSYESKLADDLNEEKRKSLEIKLSVVNAHLKKLGDLISASS